jgi:hypothetical protein
MHHPTDVIGSVIGALGCLAFAFLATRTGVAVAEANERAADDRAPLTSDGERPAAASVPADAAQTRPADVEVSP